MISDFKDISMMNLGNAGINKTFNLLATDLLPDVATNCDNNLNIQGKFFALQHIQLSSEQTYEFIQIPNPDAGAELIFTITANNKWNVNSIYFILTKGAGSSSEILITVNRATRVLYAIIFPTVQGINDTKEYTLMQNLGAEERIAAAGDHVTINLPYPMRIRGGDVIATEITNLAIGNTITNFTMFYTVDDFLTLPVRLEIVDTNGSEILLDVFIPPNGVLTLPEPRYIKRGEYSVRLTSDGFNTQSLNVKLLGNMAM